MTTPPPRTRRLSALGVAFYALLLSPSGKIISTAAAATLLAGGVMTQLRPPSAPVAQASAPAPAVPTRLAHSGASAPIFTYIEVDGQTLPVLLTENPTRNRSAGFGASSAAPSIDPSSDSRRGPGAGSSHFGARPDSPSLAGRGGRPSEASQPVGNPTPPPTAGHIPLPRTPGEQLNCTPATISPHDSGSAHAVPPGARPCPPQLVASDDSADNEPTSAGTPPQQGELRNEPITSSPGSVPELTEEEAYPGPAKLADSNPIGLIDPSEAGAPTAPLPDAPQNELLEPPFFGSPLSPPEAPELLLPTGIDDPLDPGVNDLLNPLNPLSPLSGQPEPLPTPAYDDQSPPQTATNVPEPSVIGLMLLGLAALGWTGRRRPTPTRHA